MSPVYSSHLESASTLYLFVGTVVVTVTATGPCPTSHHGTMGVAIGCLLGRVFQIILFQPFAQVSSSQLVEGPTFFGRSATTTG